MIACPRCRGRMFQEQEPTCIACGYADYGDEEIEASRAEARRRLIWVESRKAAVLVGRAA